MFWALLHLRDEEETRGMEREERGREIYSWKRNLREHISSRRSQIEAHEQIEISQITGLRREIEQRLVIEEHLTIDEGMETE